MQARRLAPSPIVQNRLAGAQILVNVFDGSPRTTVEACVSGYSP